MEKTSASLGVSSKNTVCIVDIQIFLVFCFLTMRYDYQFTHWELSHVIISLAKSIIDVVEWKYRVFQVKKSVFISF